MHVYVRDGTKICEDDINFSGIQFQSEICYSFPVSKVQISQVGYSNICNNSFNSTDLISSLSISPSPVLSIDANILYIVNIEFKSVAARALEGRKEGMEGEGDLSSD